MAISLLYAVPSSLGLFIEVLTHGYWLEQSRIEQMAFARPGRIRVSVDAIGATHSLIRGGGKFWDYTLATLNTSPRPQSNGDVSTCCSLPPVGNIRNMPIREIWHSLPKWWEHGCCMEKRFSEAERQKALVAIRT